MKNFNHKTTRVELRTFLRTFNSYRDLATYQLNKTLEYADQCAAFALVENKECDKFHKRAHRSGRSLQNTLDDMLDLIQCFLDLVIADGGKGVPWMKRIGFTALSFCNYARTTKDDHLREMNKIRASQKKYI